MAKKGKDVGLFDLIPITEVAKRMGVTRQRVDQLLKAYKVPVGRWYGRLYLTQEALDLIPDSETRQRFHGVRFDHRKAGAKKK